LKALTKVISTLFGSKLSKTGFKEWGVELVYGDLLSLKQFQKCYFIIDASTSRQMGGFSKKSRLGWKVTFSTAAKLRILEIYLFSAQNVEQFENIP
jgi:hypothetical protein